MSSAVAITLDTTAPELVFGVPVWHKHGDVLHVPYTLDEDGVVAADFENEPMDTLADELVVRTPGRAGTVHATALDEVLNASEWVLNVATPSAYPGADDSSYEGRGPAAYGDGEDAGYEGRGPATYDDGGDAEYDA